jgi:nicotinate-nucleotide adenylyltransferase
VAKTKPEVRLSKQRAKNPKAQKAAQKNKVGIFGGTFDPIHYGHLNSIETVLSELKLDEMWIVPTRQNPFKEATQSASPEHRLETVKLALSTLDAAKYKISDYELVKEGSSYTIDTLEAFSKTSPENEYFLILGADQLLGFDKWKNFKKLLKLANVVVTSRPGSDLPKNKKEWPDYIRELIKSVRGNKVSLKTGKEIYVVQLKDVAASSSEIRRKIRRGESVSHLTPGIVSEYLVSQNVYDKNELLIKDYAEFAKYCAKVLLDKGGIAVNAYDVRELVQPAEFAVAASGTSTRHTKALCELVVKEAKEKYGIHPQSIEGSQEGRWVVIDYGSLMIHVFYDFVRNEYHIEDLWSGAPRLDV